jgi:hypothetical protein
MNTIFVLVLLIIPGDGVTRVAYDKERFTQLSECLERSEARAEQLKGKVLWMTSSCVEVPVDPGSKGS